MRDESAFLQALIADPTDDGLRLVYADWLEEQGESTAAAKAEFLRLTAAIATNPGRKRQQQARGERLQRLAASLDTDWLAVVSRLPVENCQGKRQEAKAQRSYQISFAYLCDRRWEDLQTTEDQAVRSCDRCRQNVHYCDTIMEARRHAQAGHCIAVDLGVIRREDDLAPQRMWLGWPSPETLQRERERVQPDPVSTERDRRKRGQAATPPEGEGTVGSAATRPDLAPPTPTFDHGDRVRVRDGTFAGMEGEIGEVLAATGSVRVRLTIFGRPVPVELEYWQVEHIA